MKKKLLSFLLVLSIALTMIPFASVNTYAASSGPKTFVKTKTVTIKPGKTYTTPKVKLTKKMLFHIPIEIWLADKKNPDYIEKGSFKLTLRNAKGKAIYTYKDTLEYVSRKNGDGWYSNCIYYYADKGSDPRFKKGTYYFTIKNTTKRTIKVKYSIRGYTKFATKADFPKKVTMDCSTWDYTYIGKIGPGLPAIDSISSSDKMFSFSWYIDKKGKLYIRPWEADDGQKTTITVTMMDGSTKYKFKLIAKY